MYKDVYYRVNLNGFVSQDIPSTVGVKQGCVLSPLLFNLYLSDLPKIFSDSCDPVSILDTKTNCLMFADDLILISESASGLQKCLDRLDDYSSK